MLKRLAFGAMLVDHMGAALAPGLIWPRVVGRLAFPLFAASVGRGFVRSRSVPAYVSRLFLLGVVSQLPFLLVFGSDHLNICFTLAAGLGLAWLVSISDFVGAAVVVLLSAVVPMSYGFPGVLLVAASCWSAASGRLWPVLLAWVPVGWPDGVSLALGWLALASDRLPLPACSSGRGWYWFYPVHLVVIAVLVGMGCGW